MRPHVSKACRGYQVAIETVRQTARPLAPILELPKWGFPKLGDPNIVP